MALHSNTTFKANTTILYDDTYQIVIDYSGYLERIATAVENCAANLAAISSNVSSISTNFSYITGNVHSQVISLDNISGNVYTQTGAINQMSANLNAIEQLGALYGFKTTTPDGIIGLATTYRYLIMNGMAANTEDVANAEIQQLAKDNIALEANQALDFLSTLPPLTF